MLAKLARGAFVNNTILYPSASSYFHCNATRDTLEMMIDPLAVTRTEQLLSSEAKRPLSFIML